MRIYYVNSQNVKLDLTTWPYRAQTGDIYNWAWSYESMTNASRNGGKITRFYRGITDKTLTISVAAARRADYYNALKRLFETTERDVVTGSPGRLYVDEYYLSCYIKGSQKTMWESGSGYLVNTLSIVSEYPMWRKETTYSFVQSPILSSDNKRYPYRYGWRYANGLTDQEIQNAHYADSDFKLVISGPVLNPLVNIDSNIYRVDALLLAGEYLVIDSATRTIDKVQVDGGKVNMFNQRSKEYDVFAKVLPGRHKVSWDGTFDFDLTLYAERSEPAWTI